MARPKKTDAVASAPEAETPATSTTDGSPLNELAETLTSIASNPTPASFQRGADGLVIGLTYPKKPDGKIDWRKLIDPQYLDFKNKEEIEKIYGKKLLSFRRMTLMKSISRSVSTAQRNLQSFVDSRQFAIPTSLHNPALCRQLA